MLLVPNNPNIVATVLSALKVVLLPNTQLAANSLDGTGMGQVYDEGAFDLLQATFPAVLLYATPVQYQKSSRSTYTGTVEITVVYYQRWDISRTSLDALWQQVARDMSRMQANIESNDRLVVGNTNALQTIKKITLSPYYSLPVPATSGIYTLSRSMTLSCVLPPFDS